MSFATLAMIMVVGLLGPLLAARQGWHIPVTIGELLAGIAFGATGFGLLHSSDATFKLLADVGFALTMFVAGSHVPVRDPTVRSALGKGVGRAVAVGLLAVAAAALISYLFDTSHLALYAVLMASSSAALVLPIVDSLELGGPQVIQMMAQVAIADTACIVALPLVVDPSNAGRAALGAAAVAACAVVLFFGLRAVEKTGLRHKLHDISEERKFALELRISLAILFALAALATTTHVSIMLAGFAFGLAVAGVGEPRRVAKQLFAINDGFLGPLFFVWLGSSIDLRELAHNPSYIGVGVALGLGALLVHSAMRIAGLPLPLAAMSAAQLGVPIAAVTVGSQLHLLKPGESGALILGAMITIAVAAISGGIAAKHFAAAPSEGAQGKAVPAQADTSLGKATP
ncbi:cation:proton antiporter [Antrihabitans cavernicola]|uniref:Cation:proton antiporter n=1 Tax=Antrihabitans cavernicola TaxID=2495913 RepID=A0A5A7SAH6_9NOCA|nr:cation:proton antiporter [Spelaeibacter cavernicola]KAA0022299.1 cation:proton antiporter [Spelaeibacter cavernicola]